MDSNLTDQFNSALTCLALAARLYQKPVEIDTLRKEFSHQHMKKLKLLNVQIIRAAKFLGFKAKKDNKLSIHPLRRD